MLNVHIIECELDDDEVDWQESRLIAGDLRPHPIAGRITEPCTLLIGNPVEGFKLHGLFGSTEEAAGYGSRNFPEGEFTVASIHHNIIDSADEAPSTAPPIEPDVFEVFDKMTPDSSVHHPHVQPREGMTNDLRYGEPNVLTALIEGWVAQASESNDGSRYENFSEVLFWIMVTAVRVYTESIMAPSGRPGQSLGSHSVDEQLMADPSKLAKPGITFEMFMHQTLTALAENLDGHVPLSQQG